MFRFWRLVYRFTYLFDRLFFYLDLDRPYFYFQRVSRNAWLKGNYPPKPFSPGTAGFIIPPEFHKELLTAIQNQSVIYGEIIVRPNDKLQGSKIVLTANDFFDKPSLAQKHFNDWFFADDDATMTPERKEQLRRIYEESIK